MEVFLFILVPQEPCSVFPSVADFCSCHWGINEQDGLVLLLQENTADAFLSASPSYKVCFPVLAQYQHQEHCLYWAGKLLWK